MHIINGKHYYTTSEVCEQFGITTKTWSTWRERYKIRQHAVGRLVLFPVSEIERIMQESSSVYIRHEKNKGKTPKEGGDK